MEQLQGNYSQTISEDPNKPEMEENFKTICRSCGTETRSGERYCYNCGADQLEQGCAAEKEPSKPKKKRTVILLCAVVGTVILLALVALLLLFPQKHTPNFTELFENYKNNSWCEIAPDGSWMSIDSNPNDYDDDSAAFALWYLSNGSNCLNAVKDINEKLGFSSAVYKRMEGTTALQGRQYEENENYKVSWTYHPNNGLEITYEMKGK